MAGEAIESGRPTTLSVGATAEDVFEASAAGDALATQTVGTAAASLARAIRTLVLTLGVRRVVIGGGVAASGDALLAPILSAIAAERRASRLIEAVFAETSIDILEPGLEPGARGAAALARRAFLGPHNRESRNSTAPREEVGDR